jgi:hypothetical protein
MADSQVHAFLEDGPRAGETVTVHTGPDGQPPHQLVMTDPLGQGGRAEESFDIEPTTTGATTYYLQERDELRSGYVYRVQ